MLGNTRDSTCRTVFEGGLGIPRITCVRAIFDGDNAVLSLGLGWCGGQLAQREFSFMGWIMKRELARPTRMGFPVALPRQLRCGPDAGAARGA